LLAIRSMGGIGAQLAKATAASTAQSVLFFISASP
jgi:hypothetical protein